MTLASASARASPCSGCEWGAAGSPPPHPHHPSARCFMLRPSTLGCHRRGGGGDCHLLPCGPPPHGWGRGGGVVGCRVPPAWSRVGSVGRDVGARGPPSIKARGELVLGVWRGDGGGCGMGGGGGWMLQGHPISIPDLHPPNLSPHPSPPIPAPDSSPPSQPPNPSP